MLTNLRLMGHMKKPETGTLRKGTVLGVHILYNEL